MPLIFILIDKPLIAILFDVFQWHHLLLAAKNPSVAVVTFKDSIRDKGLDIENNVT